MRHDASGGVGVGRSLVGIMNDGEYPWNANATFVRGNMVPGDDYSIVLWTDSPPRLSVSGSFYLGPHRNSTGTTSSVGIADDGSGAVDPVCVGRLQANGGYYNETLDGEYVAGIGATRVTWTTRQPAGQSQLKGVLLGTVYESDLGMGVVGLSTLQGERNSRVPEMDVVSVYLGDGRNKTGSVVMGGYDEALIDHSQKAVFARADETTEVFQVPLAGIGFIGTDHKQKEVYKAPAGAPKVSLNYDEYGIRLTKEMLDPILPLIGSPTFDKDLNGYVFSSGTPNVDFSLRFTIGNGTASVCVTVPGSAFLTTDPTEDNPITQRTESGKTFLRISESDSPSLGRAFLQYVYLINAPPTIQSFHLSAVRSPFPKSKSLVAASRTSISIFTAGGNNSSQDRAPAVEPMVGGIIGGIAVALVLAALSFLFVRRRRRRRQQDHPECGTRSVRLRSAPGSEGKPGTLETYGKELGVYANGTPLSMLPPRSRQSDNSADARAPSPLPAPQRVATIGKFYSGASTVDPKSPIRRAHTSTASVGRMVTPTSVEFFGNSESRKSSSSAVAMAVARKSVGTHKEIGGGSDNESSGSVFGLNAVAKEGGVLSRENRTYLDDESSSGEEQVGDEDRILGNMNRPQDAI